MRLLCVHCGRPSYVGGGCWTVARTGIFKQLFTGKKWEMVENNNHVFVNLDDGSLL